MKQTLRQRRLLKEKVRLQNDLSTKSSIPFEDKGAYIGKVIAQGALLPSHFTANFPHWSFPALLVCGLCCYQYRAYKNKDMVYTIGNLLGIFLNATMLLRIFYFG